MVASGTTGGRCDAAPPRRARRPTIDNSFHCRCELMSMALARRSFTSFGVRHPCCCISIRLLSGDACPDHTAVHFLGDDRYGSREYVLLPTEVTLDDLKANPTLKLASIRAHQNVVFGARVLRGDGGNLLDLCGPLLDAALVDASEPGQQPQALSSLMGLCSWVTKCIEGAEESQVLSKLKMGEDDASYQAVKAIATGVPRPGHSVVGVGTYRDGEKGWKALSQEFVQLEKSDEVKLYLSRGGELVSVEHLAEQSEEYLRSAGGAMARFFFL